MPEVGIVQFIFGFIIYILTVCSRVVHLFCI